MTLRERIARSAQALVELHAQNLPLQFFMSTLNGLGDLFEDEVIPTPLPLSVRLENVTLHLVEDRPSPNITCPGVLPIDVSIPALVVTRDRSGLFSVQAAETASAKPASDLASALEVAADAAAETSGGRPGSVSHHLDLVRSSAASVETELQQRAALLAADNAGLRQQLESAAAEVQALRRRLQESEAARARSGRSQQALQAAERENKSLKQTLKYLQQELVKSGKKT